MKSKIEAFEDGWRFEVWRLNPSLCNSNWVSGATDVGMPVGYPQISIPGPAHYGGGLEQGLEYDLETKKKVLIHIRLGHL
jgi:hypothetical protein